MTLSKEGETLMQRSRDWAAAAASGDLERALTYWTNDAIVMPPDQPAIVGHTNIRAYVDQASAIPGFSIRWEPELAVLSDDGTMGYMVEHNTITFNDADGALKTQHGKAVTIWRKQADGSWKCVVDTWNNNPSDRVLPKSRA
jgi:ketosteroid isomerase-like protein